MRWVSKDHGSARAVLLPANIGKLYYLHGYEEHKQIVLDIIKYVSPNVNELVKTSAPARVEVIVQNFVRNNSMNLGKDIPPGLIIHLINLTGFSGNTYFDPLPVYHTEFKVKCDFKPLKVFSMMEHKDIAFEWSGGMISLTLDSLKQYDGIVIERYATN
jgi:hypothetical protein